MSARQNLQPLGAVSILDTIMKLLGTIGVTQKTMAFDTHVCQMFEFEGIHHSSSKLISARNEASKNIQKLCAKNRRYHAQNEHTSRIRKWKAAQNDDQNDDRTMTIFLVSKSLQAHPHREPKMASLLVRNYSIHFHCCCSCCYFFFCCCLLCCFRFFFFNQLLISCPRTPSPQER